MSATAAESLAHFATELSYRDLPAAVLDKVRAHTLDSVGCQLLGATQPWNQLVRDYAIAETPPGPSTIVGAPLSGRPEWAALANATCAQGFEIDDYHTPALIHPGAIAVPTAFAVGQEVEASDEEMILAMALGFEVSIRIGLAASPGITHGRGIHTQSAVGPFGAAIVASKLRRLNAAQTTNALGIAGSHSCGTLEFSQTGGEVKRMHAGIADMGGIRAATLAERGLTAPASILEGKRGFFQAFSDRLDLRVLTDGLGQRWELLGTSMKLYAANGMIQAPLRAIYEMITHDGLTSDDVRSITVGVSRFGQSLAGTVGPHPRQVQEAQYSIEFSIALALVRGGNGYEDYLAAAQDGFSDPRTRAVAERVLVELDEEADAEFPHVFSARVSVTRDDGRRSSTYVHAPGSAQTPLTLAQVRQKFRQCARSTVSSHALARLEAAITAMPTDRTLLGTIPHLGASASVAVAGT